MLGLEKVGVFLPGVVQRDVLYIAEDVYLGIIHVWRGKYLRFVAISACQSYPKRGVGCNFTFLRRLLIRMQLQGPFTHEIQ